ncbi:hypothetical protein KIL84_003977 [Mauremys mutica]|uniref:Uncharacterized protein n=1 Tax=Mauremys mutica TaxID=74926 RepID=A0A9D4AS21_9SAUR|nr:hypothetical protein KIL84_003977 [Mauremys mutica]
MVQFYTARGPLHSLPTNWAKERRQPTHQRMRSAAEATTVQSAGSLAKHSFQRWRGVSPPQNILSCKAAGCSGTGKASKAWHKANIIAALFFFWHMSLAHHLAVV